MEWLNPLSEFFYWFLDLVLNLDVHLVELVNQYGLWIYAILFLVIFSETGFVVTPFLPGDSLLFVAGAVAATGHMDVHLLAVILLVAAISGNQLNFSIGRWVGPKVFSTQGRRFLKPEYLERTQQFFEKHGGKTIVLSRWVPIIRTYAPFVAGVGQMPWSRFTLYNAIGGLTWIFALVYAGYFFGNLSIVRDNLSLVIIGIVVFSLLPVMLEYLRARFEKNGKQHKLS